MVFDIECRYTVAIGTRLASRFLLQLSQFVHIFCFPAKNYWAKDLIFLVTCHGEVGMQAWINGYMGIHSSGKGKRKKKG